MLIWSKRTAVPYGWQPDSIGGQRSVRLLREQVDADQDWIRNLEVVERDRTGIPTLKVGYNKTFGYYISISHAKAGKQVPDGYTRKQTLTNEERYITQDLKERESRIQLAQDSLNHLEYEILPSCDRRLVNRQNSSARWHDRSRRSTCSAGWQKWRCIRATAALRCLLTVKSKSLKVVIL